MKRYEIRFLANDMRQWGILEAENKKHCLQRIRFFWGAAATKIKIREYKEKRRLWWK
jgi:hypothetical protein